MCPPAWSGSNLVKAPREPEKTFRLSSNIPHRYAGRHMGLPLQFFIRTIATSSCVLPCHFLLPATIPNCIRDHPPLLLFSCAFVLFVVENSETDHGSACHCRLDVPSPIPSEACLYFESRQAGWHINQPLQFEIGVVALT